MVFSSAIFLLIFLPVVLLGYYICNDKFKNIWLLLVSLLFYSWGEPRYILIMLFSIVINYIFGIALDLCKKQIARNTILIIAVTADIGILILFKYMNFIVNNINAAFHQNIIIDEIALPIGISFYTFQILSYVIDVHQKKVRGGAQRNILKLGLYISFFPQLIAGPIVRYVDIEKQIDVREVNADKLYSGVRRFMVGFTKKVLIADNVSQIADIAYNMENISGALAWIGAAAYMVQIYFDFSGYSDMAIGLGKMFGFDFLENFNYPYISKSIQEFWRRWHMSLSGWFRDYVYIPLGGSRCSTIKAYRNLIVVFLLTGFWHGASWNFVVWGLYYAFFLVIEKAFLGRLLQKLPWLLQRIYTLFIVFIGWIFFRAESLGQALSYIKGLFTLSGEGVRKAMYYLNPETVTFLVIGIVFSAPIFSYLGKRTESRGWIMDGAILVLFSISVLYLTGSGFSPFLYFRF